MTEKEKVEGFHKSMERFDKIDGKHFGPCVRGLFDITKELVLEWRIRKNRRAMSIIQYYHEGMGYAIYDIESVDCLQEVQP